MDAEGCHVGPDNHKPTSLWGIAICVTLLSRNTEASTTEEPDAGKPHVRDCAGGTKLPLSTKSRAPDLPRMRFHFDKDFTGYTD